MLPTPHPAGTRQLEFDMWEGWERYLSLDAHSLGLLYAGLPVMFDDAIKLGSLDPCNATALTDSDYASLTAGLAQ
jgi:hypothetical protein